MIDPQATLEDASPARLATYPAPHDCRRWPTLQDKRWRYAVFFSTYLYQGLVAGFSLTALANYYAGRGLSASEVGLHFAIAGLPWTVQPLLWGPLVDRTSGTRMGRRRVWSVSAILAGQVALAGLLLVPDAAALGVVGAVFFAHSLAASLLDTACDRMIMDHVPPGELGRMSACTRSGFVIGTSVSAVLFAWTLVDWGFAASVRLLFGLCFAAILLPLLVREGPADALLSFASSADAHPRWKPLPYRLFLKRLVVGLSRPAALRLLMLCFWIDFAVAVFEVRFGVDLVQVGGWDAAALSRFQAGLAVAAGTLGALAIGLWSDRSGPLPALRGLFLTSAAGFCVTAILVGTGPAGAAGPVILGLTNVLPSLLIVALVPALMRASRGRAGAATQFEVFMATMNLGSVAGAAASGPVAAVLPLAYTATLVAVVFLACAGLAWRADLIFDVGRKDHTDRARR